MRGAGVAGKRDRSLLPVCSHPAMGKDEHIEVDPKTKAVLDKKGYVVETKISEGSFGKVYKAKNVMRKETAAVKVMDLKRMEELGLTGKFLDREISALINVRHPNVLHVHDIFRSAGRLYIFMEFAPNGTLTKKMQKPPGYLKENAARKWFRQCVEALHCMHMEHGMAHRDIKTDNVLMDKNDNAKLSDFGFARDFSIAADPSTTYCGTDPYFAPEIVAKKPYNPFLYDIWSMGVMLFFMLNNKYPFHWELTQKEPGKLLVEMKSRGYKKRYRPEVIHSLSPECQDIIDQMFVFNPAKRPHIVALKRHAWLN